MISGNDTSWLGGDFGNYQINAPKLTSFGTAGSGDANNSLNVNSNSLKVMAPSAYRPPAPPNYSPLVNLEDEVQRKKAIKDANDSYDQLAASTKASGFQAADNAGTVYANRLAQSGINPVASGVVAAQARLPVYSQLADINNERAKTQLDASSRADALAAQIATTVAGLQLSYSKTLADYNQQQAGYEINTNQFNRQQGLKERQNFDAEQAQKAAQLAASSKPLGVAGLGNPDNPLAGVPGSALSGYVPDFGPLVSGTDALGRKVNNTVFYGGGPAKK